MEGKKEFPKEVDDIMKAIGAYQSGRWDNMELINALGMILSVVYLQGQMSGSEETHKIFQEALKA